MTELCDGLTTRLLTTDDAQAVFEVIAAFTLGRTFKKRAVDVLAYLDRPGTSNGGTEAICEFRDGWSGTGWSGWSWSCRSVCDSRSNWPASAVSFR